MPLTDSIEQEAEQLIRQRLADVADDVQACWHHEFWEMVQRSLDRFLEMVHEHPDQPAHRLEPTVRRFLLERSFCGGCGDGMLDQNFTRCFELWVHQLVQMLEDIRRHALARGHWSDAPATPMMFG